MKRLISSVIAVVILICLSIAPARAQVERNQLYVSSGCAAFTPLPNFGLLPPLSAYCFDTTLGEMFIWGGTAAAPGPFVPMMTSCSITAPATAGTLTLNSTNNACFANVKTTSTVIATDNTTAAALKAAPTAGVVTVTGATTTDSISVLVVKF